MTQTQKLNRDYLRFINDPQIASLYGEICTIYNKANPTITFKENGEISTTYNVETENRVNMVMDRICDVIDNRFPDLFEKS